MSKFSGFMGLIAAVISNTGQNFAEPKIKIDSNGNPYKFYHNRNSQSASPISNQRKLRKNKRRANAAIKNYKF